MAIRVVLADDHPIVLDGLENLLRAAEDFDVAARCVNGREALAAVARENPDLLILDIRMPGMDGLEVLRRLRQASSETRVVLLTAALDEEEMIEAVRLGAKAVVLKETAPALLVACLRKVHGGGQWFEQEPVSKALAKLLQREAGFREGGAALTPREFEVVRMAARGMRNKEIAGRLCVSQGTVKVHLHNIYEKLGVAGRMALLLWAQEKGIV